MVRQGDRDELVGGVVAEIQFVQVAAVVGPVQVRQAFDVIVPVLCDVVIEAVLSVSTFYLPECAFASPGVLNQAISKEVKTRVYHLPTKKLAGASFKSECPH